MKYRLLVLVALSLLAHPLFAQEGNTGQAGYEDVPAFGGPESVTE